MELVIKPEFKMNDNARRSITIEPGQQLRSQLENQRLHLCHSRNYYSRTTLLLVLRRINHCRHNACTPQSLRLLLGTRKLHSLSLLSLLRAFVVLCFVLSIVTLPSPRARLARPT